MYTIGINAVFHDSAACILKDGVLLAAAEEERFTHIKHGKRPVPFSTWELPYHAIDYCLGVAGIHLSDVDNFAYSFDPSLINKNEGTTIYGNWDSLFKNYIEQAPFMLADGYPHHLQKRFVNAKAEPHKWHFVNHHLAHAASAYLCSPYASAAVMTIDGRGEEVSTSYYVGKNNGLSKIGEVMIPHSLGLLYEAVTTYLGFLHSSDEYKVMALASYGKPVYLNQFRSMITVLDDGTYKIDDYRLEERFGPKRLRNEEFGEKHFNIAHSLQKVVEETVLKLANWLNKKTGEDNLCLAGGVALNCVSNAVIRDRSPFKNIWVQPASGDDGTALGAALWIDVQQRKSDKKDFIYATLLLGTGI